MNEIMDALEAMIRRVVTEELNEQDVVRQSNTAAFMNMWKDTMRRYPGDYRTVATELVPVQTSTSTQITPEMFGTLFAQFLANTPNALNEVVKNATLDQPWFDGAIKSEVAAAGDDGLKDTIKQTVIDMDMDFYNFNDQVESVVKSMSFTVEART